MTGQSVALAQHGLELWRQHDVRTAWHLLLLLLQGPSTTRRHDGVFAKLLKLPWHLFDVSTKLERTIKCEAPAFKKWALAHPLRCCTFRKLVTRSLFGRFAEAATQKELVRGDSIGLEGLTWHLTMPTDAMSFRRLDRCRREELVQHRKCHSTGILPIALCGGSISFFIVAGACSGCRQLALVNPSSLRAHIVELFPALGVRFLPPMVFKKFRNPSFHCPRNTKIRIFSISGCPAGAAFLPVRTMLVARVSSFYQNNF